VSDLKISATPEQIAGAVYGNLLATVTNLYMIQVATLLMGGVATEIGHAFAVGKVGEGLGGLDKHVPLVTRRDRLAFAFDTVIKNLPVDSPFREPLTQERALRLETMKE
jgi:hypothetical protein